MLSFLSLLLFTHILVLYINYEMWNEINMFKPSRSIGSDQLVKPHIRTRSNRTIELDQLVKPHNLTRSTSQTVQFNQIN